MFPGSRFPSLAVLASVILAASVPHGPAMAQQDAAARTPYGTLDRTDFDAPSPTGASKPAVLSPAVPVPAPLAAPVPNQGPAGALPTKAEEPSLDQGEMNAVARAPVISGAANPPASWVPAVPGPASAKVPAAAAATFVDPAVSRLRDHARAVLTTGAVAAARAILSDPALAQDGESLAMLADTYDGEALAKAGVIGVAADPAVAARYRALAVAAGWRPRPAP